MLETFIANLPAILTALGAVVTAVGVILIAYWSYRGKERAAAAADLAEDAKREVIAVRGDIFTVGEQLDGRLSQLLKTSTDLAHAEGRLEGKAERRGNGEPIKPNG